MAIPHYDALLILRVRHEISCETLGKLLDIPTAEIQAIEADAAVIQIENIRRFKEVASMSFGDIGKLIAGVGGPGEFRMTHHKLEVLKWRWRNGLTHETAAEKLGMEQSEYRRAETTSSGKSLLVMIRKLERQARSSKGGK